MAKTFGEIKSKVWTLLGQKFTSVNFSSAIVGNRINALSQKILRGTVSNLLDPRIKYSSGRLWIQEGSYYVRFKLPTHLTQDLGLYLVDSDGNYLVDGSGNYLVNPAWNNIIYCDTSTLLNAGYVEIEGEIFQYTAKTATSLTGVVGGSQNYTSGMVVKQLYQIPSTFERPTKVNKIVGDTGVLRAEVPYSDNGSKSVYYQIARKDDVPLLRFMGFDNEDLIEIIYSEKYTNLVLDEDVSVFPDEFAETVVATLVAGELGYEKGMINSEKHLMMGYANLQDFYTFFNNEVFRVKQHIKPASFGFNSLRTRGKNIQ